MSYILDGATLSKTKQELLRTRVSEMNVTPHLVIVNIGDDVASQVYIEKKRQFGESIGVKVTLQKFDAQTSEDEIVSLVQRCNEDATVHGIIVQLPMPNHLHKERVVNTISPEKDVDGLTARNMWRLMDNQKGIIPATALGIQMLLEEVSISLEGKHVVIVGDSFLVGKSTAIHFLNLDATVTVCHDKTKNLDTFTKQADILVTAVGKENIITAKHVHENQVVIDVGIIRNSANSIVGDVAYDEVSKVVHAITPVPGGIGPMTVASLFENIVSLVEAKN